MALCQFYLMNSCICDIKAILLNDYFLFLVFFLRECWLAISDWENIAFGINFPVKLILISIRRENCHSFDCREKKKKVNEIDVCFDMRSGSALSGIHLCWRVFFFFLFSLKTFNEEFRFFYSIFIQWFSRSFHSVHVKVNFECLRHKSLSK